MNKHQVRLIQESFAHVVPIAEVAAGLFYGRLFEVNPELRPMFRGDMQEQGRKLISTLQLVVLGLSDLDNILPAVRHLGRKHVGYGVQDEHYALVGEALIWTLNAGLQSLFTAEVEQAWRTAYDLLATTMLQAAQEHAVLA